MKHWQPDTANLLASALLMVAGPGGAFAWQLTMLRSNIKWLWIPYMGLICILYAWLSFVIVMRNKEHHSLRVKFKICTGRDA